MQVPEWAKYRRVDDMVECYPISDETQKALLEAMPNAYGGEAPGEDDWPEPDAARDAPYKLSNIWDKLAQTVQEDLVRAYEEER